MAVIRNEGNIISNDRFGIKKERTHTMRSPAENYIK